ncbi:MAG TPA: aspartate ammonia-lyase [Porphyromonadaceae bacterium]|nr:aspartate ammonia-lyase [Porphyromonadaceae bacterium]
MNNKNFNLSGKTRSEHDLLGNMEVPVEYYFGIQTMRALDNFNISSSRLYHYPHIIVALSDVKAAAAEANQELGLIEPIIAKAIVQACKEIRKGKYHEYFVVDMIQGGAGTSVNMNANEVIANRALEMLGHSKGEYTYCHPNNHVNRSQSTNDTYPTAMKIALYRSIGDLVDTLRNLIVAFHEKGKKFSGVIKMGRTQLQDAVPMTLGQEFEAFAATLEEEVLLLERNRKLLLEINMGATAIGTGINADPRYAEICTRHLAEITGLPVVKAENMIEATSDTGVFIINSSTIKRLAVKISKICNDLRLLSSGPRTGLNEINLPPMQPGSSIMPGKVNPVIPEVVNQIAFKVIGNDLTVTMASEAGQLQLNVMEPIIVFSLMESISILIKGLQTLRKKCIEGITPNEEHCKNMVLHSIGLVTALNPYLGYETSSQLAAEALKTGKGVYELVLEKKLMEKEKLDDILKPENMIKPRKMS